MTEHTKLPWRVEEGTDLIWGACSDDPSTYGMGYSIIQGQSAHYTRGKPGMDEREANAAFIVKAVNSHHALVKALEPLDHLASAIFTTYKNALGTDIESYGSRPDDEPVWAFDDTVLTYGHLRAARAALHALSAAAPEAES